MRLSLDICSRKHTLDAPWGAVQLRLPAGEQPYENFDARNGV